MIDFFCEELNDYLQRNYNTAPAYIGKKRTIDARTDDFDLYFRYKKYFKTPTLVIARIGFKEERSGHGTNLLRFLAKHAYKNNFEKLELECACIDAQEFGKRFGFKIKTANCLGKGNEFCDMEVSVKELIKNTK